MKLNEEQKAIYEDLSMAEKIAILLIQLGEDVTTMLFTHMDIDIITEISKYIGATRMSVTITKTITAKSIVCVIFLSSYIKAEYP